MSKFYVGQRVRVVHGCSVFFGLLATITSMNRQGRIATSMSRAAQPGELLFRLDVDGHGQMARAPNGEYGFLAAVAEEIEPIPDRPELSTWEATRAICGWHPPVKVGAA